VVWEAYQRVKTNKGAAGVDDQSIAEFEQDRDKNLYRIWNRLSSGSYFPPPVKAVEIPTAEGSGVHVLGVPNRGRSGGADRGQDISGTAGRADLPSGLLRLPAEEVRVGRGRGVPAAVLAQRLGG
jgi:hypothetical protein